MEAIDQRTGCRRARHPRKFSGVRPGNVLERTCSTSAAMLHLGVGKTKLHELLQLGERFKGCHPLKGGLYPSFRVSHKNRRITIAAIERHKAHMTRLASDGVFLAQMRALAQQLGLEVAA